MRRLSRKQLAAIHLAYARRFGSRSLREHQAVGRARKQAADSLRKIRRLQHVNRNTTVSVNMAQFNKRTRWQDTLDSTRIKALKKALELHNNNVTLASEWLGMQRSNLGRLKSKFNLPSGKRGGARSGSKFIESRQRYGPGYLP